MLRRVGNLELLRPLGRGGMAQVFLARQTDLGGEVAQLVAVKFIQAQDAQDPELRALFVKEARLAVNVGYKNVVKTMSVHAEGDELYMVMEYVDGFNLREFLRAHHRGGEVLPIPLAAFILGEILDGLDFAHSLESAEGSRLGIIHRDISPDNIMVSVNGEVKIADFGIARLGTATTGDAIRGKTRYMAPEHARGEAVTYKVDLFAAGAVFHELLSGSVFRGAATDAGRLAIMAASGEVPPLKRKGIPKELEALRRSLLDPDPERRPRTAEHALSALRQSPVYRTCAMELRALCRRYCGVHGPRSGLGSVLGLEQGAARESTPDAETVTVQAADSDSLLATVLPASSIPRPASAGRRYLLVPVSLAGVVALGVLVASILPGLAPVAAPSGAASSSEDLATDSAPVGLRVGTPPTSDPRTAPSESPSGLPSAAPVAAREPPADATAPGHPASPTRDPTDSPTRVPASRERSKAPREPERRPAAPGSGRGDSTPSSPAPPPTASSASLRVDVQFRLAGPRLAWVRLDGSRVFVLEPADKGQVLTGRHTVQWRLSDHEPWRDGGIIELEAGRSYRIRVHPDGPRLEVL